MTETVFITAYNNRYPDDGYEIGGVYESEDEAEEAAENQSDINGGWEREYVIRKKLRKNDD